MIQDLSRREGKFINGCAIDYITSKYQLICDCCGREVKYFNDFMEAVQYKKDNNWQSKKFDGQWTDMCPDCQD